jgi:hypothetical protein
MDLERAGAPPLIMLLKTSPYAALLPVVHNDLKNSSTTAYLGYGSPPGPLTSASSHVILSSEPFIKQGPYFQGRMGALSEHYHRIAIIPYRAWKMKINLNPKGWKDFSQLAAGSFNPDYFIGP